MPLAASAALTTVASINVHRRHRVHRPGPASRWLAQVVWDTSTPPPHQCTLRALHVSAQWLRQHAPKFALEKLTHLLWQHCCWRSERLPPVYLLIQLCAKRLPQENRAARSGCCAHKSLDERAQHIEPRFFVVSIANLLRRPGSK